MRIARDAYAREKGAYLIYGWAEGVEVKEEDAEVTEFLRKVEEEVRRKYVLEKVKDVPVIRAYRDFMWRIGIDPTKIRPSSEALLRRALRGSIPTINSLVDLGNAVSLRYLVPIGIYDLDKAKDSMILRKAREGEIFLPIGKGEVRLNGNEVVLADEEGPMHLFPYRDSRRTMVTLDTKRALVVGAGVNGVEEELVKKAVSEILNFLREKGAEVSENVYGCEDI